MIKSNKKKAFKHSAVLPPKDDSVVSILRLRYCKEEFTIQHGKHLEEVIPGQRFHGIMKVTQNDINAINEWAMSEESCLNGVEGVNGINAHIISSPMINDDDYVGCDVEVYLEDPTIRYPMHAEIKYPMNHTVELQVQTRLRNYANELLKRLQCRLIDEDGNLQENWEQVPL